MKSYNSTMEVIKRVSGQDSTLVIPKIFLELTGEINLALVLNQMIFYSTITKRRDGYFYKSYKEWKEEVYLSQYQVSRATGKLIEMGLVETKLKKAHGSPTLHYKVNEEALHNRIIKKLDNGISTNSIMDNEVSSQSLTEITTENYTEIKRYTIINNSGYIPSYYNSKYKDKFGKEHPTVTKDQLDNIEHMVVAIQGQLDIDDEVMVQTIDKHFAELSEANNGAIFSYLGHNELDTPVRRYADELEY